MAGEERRSKVRRTDDDVADVVNGWKEKQEHVLETLKDLKEGQKELVAEVRQSREAYLAIHSTPCPAVQAIHSTPCPAVEEVRTKINTGMRVILWFITPLFIALAGITIAMLFKVILSGGVQ